MDSRWEGVHTCLGSLQIAPAFFVGCEAREWTEEVNAVELAWPLHPCREDWSVITL